MNTVLFAIVQFYLFALVVFRVNQYKLYKKQAYLINGIIEYMLIKEFISLVYSEGTLLQNGVNNLFFALAITLLTLFLPTSFERVETIEGLQIKFNIKLSIPILVVVGLSIWADKVLMV